jgi:hypothetical protein
MPITTFEPEGHTYTIDGRVVPSVTQLLHEAGLVNTRYYREEHRKRGTEVHLACQLFDEGTLEENPDARYWPYLQGWKAYLNFSRFQVEQIELQMYSERGGFAGTLDRLGRFPDSDIPVIIDLKSGMVPKATKLQTAGYATLARELGLGKTFRRLAVQLFPNGRCRPHEFPLTQLKQDSDRFLQLVQFNQWRSEYVD